MSNQANLLLSEGFFNKPPNDCTSILAHEATHAIQDADYVTLDNGGYINTLQFFDADLPLRQKNASHFQYVIERIQGAPHWFDLSLRRAATASNGRRRTSFRRRGSAP